MQSNVWLIAAVWMGLALAASLISIRVGISVALKPALIIGAVGFISPFLVAGAFAYWGAHWDRNASYIAGISLLTTSVAVVYAVMVESGLNRTDIGKRILAACFVNDFGTVLALGIVFGHFNAWLALFVAVTAVRRTRHGAGSTRGGTRFTGVARVGIVGCAALWRVLTPGR